MQRRPSPFVPEIPQFITNFIVGGVIRAYQFVVSDTCRFNWLQKESLWPGGCFELYSLWRNTARLFEIIRNFQKIPHPLINNLLHCGL